MARIPLTEEVSSSIAEGIRNGRWPVGSKLPTEPQLMEELSVGRSTVREAVKALSQAGLIEVRRGLGTFVLAEQPARGRELTRIATARLSELNECRRMLEVEVARLATERGTRRQLATVERAVVRMERAARDGDRVGFAEADIAFHRAVAAATSNEVIVEIYDAIGRRALEALTEYLATVEMVDAAAVHRTLVDAIRSRDPERAADAAAETLGFMADVRTESSV